MSGEQEGSNENNFVTAGESNEAQGATSSSSSSYQTRANRGSGNVEFQILEDPVLTKKLQKKQQKQTSNSRNNIDETEEEEEERISDMDDISAEEMRSIIKAVKQARRNKRNTNNFENHEDNDNNNNSSQETNRSNHARTVRGIEPTHDQIEHIEDDDQNVQEIITNHRNDQSRRRRNRSPEANFDMLRDDGERELVRTLQAITNRLNDTKEITWHLPKYNGGKNLSELEDRLEEALATGKIKERNAFNKVANALEGSALIQYKWWVEQREIDPRQDDVHFLLRKLREKFIGDQYNERAERRKKFYSMKQRDDETVAQFSVNFIEEASKAGISKEIQNEQFLISILPKLRMNTCLRNTETLEHSIRSAKEVEKALELNKRADSQTAKKIDNDPIYINNLNRDRSNRYSNGSRNDRRGRDEGRYGDYRSPRSINSSGCFNCGSREHMARDCTRSNRRSDHHNRSRSNSPDISGKQYHHIHCRFCGRNNHTEENCMHKERMKAELRRELEGGRSDYRSRSRSNDSHQSTSSRNSNGSDNGNNTRKSMKCDYCGGTNHTEEKCFKKKSTKKGKMDNSSKSHQGEDRRSQGDGTTLRGDTK